MKKIWLLFIVLGGLFLLAGCTDEENPTVTPTVESPILTDELPYHFTVEVRNLYNEVQFSQIITFGDEESRNTLEILDANLEIIYQVFDFGVFVYGIGGFFPTEYGASFNYWLGLYVNDVISSVGIQDIELVNEMTITFKEKTMLDDTDVAVDQLIYGFITNHLSTYINDTVIHQDVLAALAKLYLMGYPVGELTELLNETVIQNYLDSVGNETIGAALKSAVVKKVFGIDFGTTLTAINEYTATNYYDATSLMNALFLVNPQSDQIEALKTMLLEGEPDFMDPDYAGMLLVALAPYMSEEAVGLVVDEMLTYLKDSQVKEGIESWGSPNAASTAMVILGLVAQGQNPRGEAFTVEETDLIEALLAFQVNGAFKWLLTDESVDLNFSTPQAFAALVAYKLYRDVWENPPVYLYDLVDLQNT